MSRLIRKLCLSLVVSVLVCLTIVLMVVGFEYYTRYHFRVVVQTAHGWDYFFGKSHHRFGAESNSLGYRGVEFGEKQEGVYRVVVIGDSLAWGQGVLPYTSRFPELTEKLLHQQAAGRQIEIFNLGFPGRNLNHHMVKLQTVFDLAPDFVLYQWYVNDVDEDPDVPAFYRTLVKSKILHQELKKKYVTYILLHRAGNWLRTVLGLQKSYTQYLVDRFQDSESPESVWADQTLNELITQLEEAGIEVGIVLFPEFTTRMSAYKLGFLHDRVLATCTERALPCLDFRAAYLPYGDRMADLRVNPLDAHPSKLAHAIAAEAIAERFGPIWTAAYGGAADATLMSLQHSQ